MIFASSRLLSSSEPTILNFGHFAPPKSVLDSILFEEESKLLQHILSVNIMT